jgi:Icc-related predicted phosphoesterase
MRGFEVFSMGHIHENSCRNDVRDTVEQNPKTGYTV